MAKCRSCHLYWRLFILLNFPYCNATKNITTISSQFVKLTTFFFRWHIVQAIIRSLAIRSFCIVFISICGVGARSLACGPQNQDWTWAGVNQYRPDECTCEELRLALNEEEVVYLGDHWTGTYLFSKSGDCEKSSLKSTGEGRVKDRRGQSCQLGFQCTASQQNTKSKVR